MFTWIHNCPQRQQRVQETVSSVKQSDISDWELWCHPEGLSAPHGIEEWWEERLLQAADKSDYFLRLEDDTIVCKSIENRVKEWDALSRTDFAIGSLFRWESATAPFWYPKVSEDTARIQLDIGLYGPGLVFKSEHVPAIVEILREKRKSGDTHRFGLVNFDWSLFYATTDLGLSCYLHRPSLVQCTNWNSETTMREDPHAGYFADDFLEN